MFATTRVGNHVVLLACLVASFSLCLPCTARSGETDLQIGLSRAKITPSEPIRMAGYASRDKPSEGVLGELFAKAMAFEDSTGNRAVLLTVDVIGFNAQVAEFVFERIREKTSLERRQVLLCPSHTHAGPVIGIAGATGYDLPDEEAACVHRYCEKLANQLAELAADAIADLEPAKVAWGVGVTNIVMNRRESTERGVRLGFNPRGYVDRSVPVMRVDSPTGKLRALLFGCACHNTTLTGKHFTLSGDYAGFAQQYVENQIPGVQAMFMIGCGGSANPYPRGTVDAAEQNGRSLAVEVCRVADGQLAPVRGPLRADLDLAILSLKPVPERDALEEMTKGPGYFAGNAREMLEALKDGTTLPTEYSAPFALWQFGDDLTLVALSGEVVNGYVPLLETALGPRKLWIAAYANDCFGYLPTAKVLSEGGYETRCLYTVPGFFPPEVEDEVVAKVREMAERVGRALPE